MFHWNHTNLQYQSFLYFFSEIDMFLNVSENRYDSKPNLLKNDFDIHYNQSTIWLIKLVLLIRAAEV